MYHDNTMLQSFVVIRLRLEEASPADMEMGHNNFHAWRDCIFKQLIQNTNICKSYFKIDVNQFNLSLPTANCMFKSFEAGEAAQLPGSHSIASGLSPPFAGKTN